MTCCGKSRAVLHKGKNIAAGFANLAAGKKYEFTDGRIRTCWTCEMQTWLSGSEYTKWLLVHGVKVIANFTELEKLPMLPKYDQSPKRRNLYCRLCKCFVPAKARVTEEKCPLDKWDNRETANGRKQM